MLTLCAVALIVQVFIAAYPTYVLYKLSKEDATGRLPQVSAEPKHLPTMCAHRGVNDANSSDPMTTALLNLCLNHGVCCADYDISLTADRVPIVAHPSEARKLFADKAEPVEEQGIGNGLEKAGSGGGQAPFTFSDFTLREIRERDPMSRTVAELRAIVDVAVALKGMNKDLLITLEPKAATNQLLQRVVDKILTTIEEHVNIFVVILPTEPLVRKIVGTDANPRKVLPSSLRTGSTDGSGHMEVKESTPKDPFRFALPLRDRDLQQLLNSKGSGREVIRRSGASAMQPPPKLAKAMSMCASLCPGRGPKWANYVMPSVQFVRSCSTLRYEALRDYGTEFYRKNFGRCSRNANSDHAQHMVWIVDTEGDLKLLPPNYLPSYVVSNRPTQLKKELQDAPPGTAAVVASKPPQ